MSAGKQVSDDASKDVRKSVHSSFSWVDPRLQYDPVAEFAATTYEICQGIGLCIDLAHSSDQVRLHNLDADHGGEEIPILTVADTERLLFLARASAKLLAGFAERQFGRMNTAVRCTPADTPKGGEV